MIDDCLLRRKLLNQWLIWSHRFKGFTVAIWLVSPLWNIYFTNHNPVVLPGYHRVCNKSNMTCVISEAGTVTLPEYLNSLLVFSEFGFARSSVSFVVFCKSLSFCFFYFRVSMVLTFDLENSDYWRILIIPLVSSNLY